MPRFPLRERSSQAEIGQVRGKLAPDGHKENLYLYTNMLTTTVWRLRGWTRYVVYKVTHFLAGKKCTRNLPGAGKVFQKQSETRSFYKQSCNFTFLEVVMKLISKTATVCQKAETK